jgi:hypothetical protein
VISAIAIQARLQMLGFDVGPADGKVGPRTCSALQSALTQNPMPLTKADIEQVAEKLTLVPAAVGAVYDVESSGRGFHPKTLLPIILYEPHVFHRLTDGAFSKDHPEVSYQHWGDKPYPTSQDGRYAQLLLAFTLAPDAALQSASYGLFQIMGFNWKPCGESDVLAFVLDQGHGEAAQLNSFAAYIRSQKLDDDLREGRWADFARQYNGPSYATNFYDQKLKAAYQKRGGR